MVFSSSLTRWTLKGLASTAAAAAGRPTAPRTVLRLPSRSFASSIVVRDAHGLTDPHSSPPSSSLTSSTTSTPPLPRITFEPNFFSSLDTLESVQSVLLETRAFTTDSTFRSPADRRQEDLVVHYLAKAVKLDDEPRNAYLKSLDQRHRPMTVVDQDRMATAREHVRKGLFDLEDSVSMEEWEKERSKRKAFALKGLEGRERRSKEVEVDRDIRKYRRRTIARREVRRELEEEKMEGKAEGEVEEETSKP